jgi:hypothetical protein
VVSEERLRGGTAGRPCNPGTGAVPAPVMNNPRTGVAWPASFLVGRIHPNWSSVMSRCMGCAPGQRSSAAISSGRRIDMPRIVLRNPRARFSTVSIMRSANPSACPVHPPSRSNGAAGQAR